MYCCTANVGLMCISIFQAFQVHVFCLLCDKSTFPKWKVSCSRRVTEGVTAKLIGSAYHTIERDGILATRLCTHKDDVELTNENKLQQLPGLNHTLHSYIQ